MVDFALLCYFAAVEFQTRLSKGRKIDVPFLILRLLNCKWVSKGGRIPTQQIMSNLAPEKNVFPQRIRYSPTTTFQVVIFLGGQKTVPTSLAV